MSALRVLHVITGLDAGGAEGQLRELVRHTRHHAEVVSLTTAGPVAEQIVSDGTTVTSLGMRSSNDLSVVPRLAGYIRSHRIDVVHTHLWRACLYGRFAARFAGCRTVVATEHSLGARMTEDNPFDQPGRRLLYRAAERVGRATIAVSPSVVDALRQEGIADERIHLIPNGIDVRSFRPDPAARARIRADWGIAREATVVGTVGRLVASKGTHQLVEAVRTLPSVVLLVVGDGPERTRLAELADRWSIADRVIFAGETREPAALYASMDVFATACAHETFGLAVVEAIASGLPVVYVHCPAVDQLADRRPPWVRQVAAEPVSLRDGITQVLALPPDVSGPPSLPPAYDIAHTVARIDALYESLHDSAGPVQRSRFDHSLPASPPRQVPTR